MEIPGKAFVYSCTFFTLSRTCQSTLQYTAIYISRLVLQKWYKNPRSQSLHRLQEIEPGKHGRQGASLTRHRLQLSATGPALHEAKKLAPARLKEAADPLRPRPLPAGFPVNPDAPPAEARSRRHTVPACSRAWAPGRRAPLLSADAELPGRREPCRRRALQGPHLRPGRRARLKLAEATGLLAPSGYEKPRPSRSGRVNHQSQNDKAKIHSSCSSGNLRCSAGQSESS